MLTAGEKTEYITVNRDTVIRTKGAVTGSTTDTVCSVWASVLPLTSSEYWRSQQTTSKATYRARIDYRSDILASDYVMWGATKLKITGILGNKPANETTLMCEAVNA